MTTEGKKNMAQKAIRRAIEWILIMTFAGYVYVCLELLFRGRSDITMMFCASICVIPMFALNEWYTYDFNFIAQIVICALFATLVELIFGLTFNRDYHIWDYRNQLFNYKGQICLLFSLVWMAISAVVIPLLDFIDIAVFREGTCPYYVICKGVKIQLWKEGE